MQQLHTLKDIEQAIATHPLVSLYIKAPICGVCTVVAAQLDSALAEEGNVYAVKADIAEIPEMAGRFHVLTAPAWLLFYQGKEVERMARFIPQAQMKQTLAKWTKSSRKRTSVTGLSMFQTAEVLIMMQVVKFFKMICETLKNFTALYYEKVV